MPNMSKRLCKCKQKSNKINKDITITKKSNKDENNLHTSQAHCVNNISIKIRGIKNSVRTSHGIRGSLIRLVYYKA